MRSAGPHRTALPLAALLAALLPSAAPAQISAATEASAEGDGPARFGPVIVEGTLPEKVEEVPAAARRLDAETMREQRPYTLHDAIESLPGVRTLDDDALGRRSGIGVRGAPARRSRKTLLLEDGVPINAAPYIDSSGHYTPPIQRLETIDVLMATGSTLHGPINNHGIVNFRNKGPTATPTTSMEIAAGNLDGLSRHFMHRRTDGPVGSVFSYTGMDADGSFDVENTRFDDYFGSLDFDLGGGHRLGISATYLRERSDYDESNLTPQEFAITPRKKRDRFGQEFNTIAVDYQKYDLQHAWQGDRLRLTTRAFASRLDRPRFTVDPEEASVDALPEIELEDPEREFVPGVSGVMVSRTRDYRNLGAETRFVLQIPGQRLSHDLQWGASFSRGFLDDKRSFGEPGEVLDKDNPGQFVGENELAAARLTKFQSSAGGVFLQDAIAFMDWTLTTGLRVEHYRVRRDQRFRGDNLLNIGETDRQTLYLPSLALLYRGIEDTELFASVGRGYTPAFARTAEDFPLEPETAINSQLGLRARPLPGLQLEGAVFHSRFSDTVVQLPFTIDGENLRINAADSRSVGLDLSLSYVTRPLVGNLQGEGSLSYGYTRATFTEGAADGNRVPNVPGHAGTLTLGLRDPARWHASISLIHLGHFFSDVLNTRDLVLADEDREPVQAGDSIEIREVVVLGRIPSRTLLSARAGYTLPLPGPEIELWASVRNLTDRLYIADLENGIRPGARRSWLAGVTLQLD